MNKPFADLLSESDDVAERLDKAIMATPSGPERTLLTDARIIIKFLSQTLVELSSDG